VPDYKRYQASVPEMLYLQKFSFIVVIFLPQGWHCMPMSYEEFMKEEIMAGSNARGNLFVLMDICD
jgi:hypothetical protein